MLSNLEQDYIRDRQDYVISYDGVFTFSDVEDWTPTSNRSIESIVSDTGRLRHVETNIHASDMLSIVATVTRQQMRVLLDYYKNKKKALILFTNVRDASFSFKFNECVLATDPSYMKAVTSIADIPITLTFQCSHKEETV